MSRDNCVQEDLLNRDVANFTGNVVFKSTDFLIVNSDR